LFDLLRGKRHLKSEGHRLKGDFSD
jgi:hypothetical protein